MNLSNYAEAALRTLIFRTGTGLTKPGELWVGLTTVMPDDTTTGSTAVENSGDGYARQQLDPGDSNWSAVSALDGITTNLSDLEWTADGGDWDEVVGIIIVDAATAGNVVFWGELDQPKTLADGETLTIEAGELSIAFA